MVFSERTGGERRRQPLDAHSVPAVPGLPPLPAVRGLTEACLWGLESLHQEGQSLCVHAGRRGGVVGEEGQALRRSVREHGLSEHLPNCPLK